MRAFVVGQTVFLLHDRFVTVGQLRSGDKGRVIALEGDRAWVEFRLSRIAHKELVKLGDVGWVSNCPDPECATTTDEHKEGCALDMSTDAMHERILPGARKGVW
jgi:hypothetical protein